jgi:hypothetical protein
MRKQTGRGDPQDQDRRPFKRADWLGQPQHIISRDRARDFAFDFARRGLDGFLPIGKQARQDGQDGQAI